MSDENKLREELKAEAVEAIDALSLEELENVSGGAWSSEKGYFCQYCGETFSGQFAPITLSAHMIGRHPEYAKKIKDMIKS